MIISTDVVPVKHRAFEDIIEIWLEVVIKEGISGARIIGVGAERAHPRSSLPASPLQAFEFLLMILSISYSADCSVSVQDISIKPRKAGSLTVASRTVS